MYALLMITIRPANAMSAKPLPSVRAARARREEHRAGHHRKRDRGAEVRLEQDENQEHAEQRADRPPQLVQRARRLALREVRREPDRERELRELRGLERCRAEADPAARTVDRLREDKHRRASEQRARDERRREQCAAACTSSATRRSSPRRRAPRTVPCRSRYDIGFAPPTTADADVAL